MASCLPTRLLCQINGQFSVVNSSDAYIESFDIVSYTWGAPAKEEWDCGIPGVDWVLKIAENKMEDIKRLMITENIQYLWADCVCIKQTSDADKAVELSRMFEYYKSAERCHILLDMPVVWNPQQIVDDLKFLDHVRSHMKGSALAAGAPGLMPDQRTRLQEWADANWAFEIPKTTVRTAAIDMGVLNCYATCISRIGELETWMGLALDSLDKSLKLQEWIQESRWVNNASIDAVLRVIEEDEWALRSLRQQVRGIESARTDIINGGPHWWHDNTKGVANIFSAVSLTPRSCGAEEDIFRGLLGIFSGLFTSEEIKEQLSGKDMEKMSFNFFKQLSIKTERAWTKLAISSRERGEWDWIPVVENYSSKPTTDCFAGVVSLGRVKTKGQAKSAAVTGVKGSPKKYMKIRLVPNTETAGFSFVFKGCNCGKKMKKGMFSKELIPTYDQPRNVVKDETGKVLVQCATILASLMDPSSNFVEYRQRLLRNLRPNWRTTDPCAKPTEWEDRCVSGTAWEDPSPQFFRSHNMSMNYRMVDFTSFESRLWNENTEKISCEVRVNCGCTVTAPFAMIFEALRAIEGSSLGDTRAARDLDDRIILRDGRGLVQIGAVGNTFDVLGFGGSVEAYRSHAASCKNLKSSKPVIPKIPWPTGRALVREEFAHGIMAQMRDYGYIWTGGSGNLLISRDHVMDRYKIIGVCIDEYIENEKGEKAVTIR
ncbi:hypothetical protein COCC4DRAFT_73096 [Bipolaris maydis ATCC 48331]|uniref:Heterokaryon incompatibility domain-containing protein n=2 Tax=Cochliobolus heterostrophus TaxID=5016 RepID=M2TKM3_COCH5|nr:uncharacterized protein COCC4DRAFT_73096 [Bipolaris maydis ATCC 48331]EMD87034.1 hypothetical protein COCHEDRAFT_1185414 [Bipolaris maydis C5]KAJ5021636.1 hypothetical protein J3E73DRAFT_434747 [Bipolaris maydis]ENI03973.1 hypothetical protein COCC4DRAFT_73096 [Bipolaris maydis ATCC 48331]KAJ6204355.1 hypothetical protein PSV09DRAFT_1185414 [Bipolaris maydis]KAJ6265736.1 hypothetical protein PSV08DRAFT_232080 [Bipolaris maydis]